MHDLVQRLIASYQHALQTGGYPYIVFLMALESSVVPLPSELVIPPAVILVGAGNSSMSYGGIVLAAAIGSWIGATVMYWAARTAGRPLVLRYGSLVLIAPSKVEQAERWSQRFGSFGIFLSRMLPVVRHLIGIPAGIVRMNYLKFSLYTFLGSAFWCAVLAYVSFIAGKDERLMRGEIREITLWVAGAAGVLGAAYYFLVHRYSRKEA
ncbi:MAG TPA: DedA family protein [Opitutaceae bacterium]|nr:DedA family protein [Opitutaceae bacterium]